MLLNGHEVTTATLRDVLRERRHLGDKVFATIDGVRLTFAEADERANRVANSLRAAGIGPGDVVATYMHNSVEHICAWFGCAKLGAIWSPLNIALVNLDLLYTLRNAGPKAVILDGELAANYSAIRDELAADLVGQHGAAVYEVVNGEAPVDFGARSFAELLSGSAEEPDVEIDPAAPAAIVYTGGSTGMPKGVVISSLWFVVAALRYQEMFDVRTDDSHLGVGQLCHAIGSSIDVFCPLYWGISTTMQRWFSASRFWDLAREHDATIVGCLVGPLIAMLVNNAPGAEDRNHTVRVASSGTAQIPSSTVAEFERRFGVELLEIYGQTESGPLGGVGQRRGDKPYHSQGRPNGWCEMMIGDDRDVPCPPNVDGQILLRPTIPHTFLLGYHKAPDKFAEACANLWFHTGDIGCIDELGFLHFKGRFAHSIRHRGENVSAFEVEQTMLLHTAVHDCAAVGVPSPIGEEDVKLYVELAEGATFDPADLIEFCRTRLAYFKVPRYIEVIDVLPRSAAKNEIERHRLRDRGIADAWDREAAGISVRRQR